MKDLKRPCYVQVVSDLLNGIKKSYPEFAARKHPAEDEMIWKYYAQMAININRLQGHPNVKKEYARQMIEFIRHPGAQTYQPLLNLGAKLGVEHPALQITQYMAEAARHKIPNYLLTEKEEDVILAAEEYGRGKPGLLLEYD